MPAGGSPVFGKLGVGLATGGVTGIVGTLTIGEDVAATVTVAVQLTEPASLLVTVPVYVVVTEGVTDREPEVISDIVPMP